MMVALLLYAYARGQRSSRVIERECVEDIAFRLIAANRQPDHCTIARFRQRHETALAGLFGEVLALCARAGLAGVGVVAVDGTKVHANASHHANRDYEQIAREILQEAAEVDASRPAGYLTRLEWRRPDPRRILRETAGQAAAGRGPSVSSVYPAPTVEANAVTQGPGLRGTTGGGREAYRLDGPDGARGSRRRGEDAAIGT